jgi:hypothetical protein
MMLMNKTCSFAIFGVLASTALAADAGTRHVAALFGSQAALDAVRLAHEVDACVLKRVPGAPQSAGKPAGPDRYEETAFVPLPATLIADLSEKLLDPQSYSFPASGGLVLSKLCVPVYQVRLRFKNEDDVVAVDFCFGCAIARVVHNGREIKTVDFDPSYATFRRAFVAVFPNDETLKQTKPKL